MFYITRVRATFRESLIQIVYNLNVFFCLTFGGHGGCPSLTPRDQAPRSSCATLAVLTPPAPPAPPAAHYPWSSVSRVYQAPTPSSWGPATSGAGSWPLCPRLVALTAVGLSDSLLAHPHVRAPSGSVPTGPCDAGRRGTAARCPVCTRPGHVCAGFWPGPRHAPEGSWFGPSSWGATSLPPVCARGLRWPGARACPLLVGFLSLRSHAARRPGSESSRDAAPLTPAAPCGVWSAGPRRGGSAGAAACAPCPRVRGPGRARVHAAPRGLTRGLFSPCWE